MVVGSKHIAANFGRMPKFEASERYRERHRRLGLCVNCNRKAKTGMLQCRVCLARTRERWIARHPVFCAECRKLVTLEERWRGNRIHKLCAQKRRARYPQQHRLAALAYQRRHRKLGLCPRCPRKAFKGALCRKHYKMYKATG